MSVKAVKGSGVRPSEADIYKAIESLIRKLVQHAAKAAPPAPEPESPTNGRRDVLFSREVDGVRCVLVKTQPAELARLALSPREQEIVRLIAKGYPNKSIAAALDISIWTVSTHLRRIFAKLGVGSRAAMIAKISELERR